MRILINIENLYKYLTNPPMNRIMFFIPYSNILLFIRCKVTMRNPDMLLQCTSSSINRGIVVFLTYITIVQMNIYKSM